MILIIWLWDKQNGQGNLVVAFMLNGPYILKYTAVIYSKKLVNYPTLTTYCSSLQVLIKCPSGLLLTNVKNTMSSDNFYETSIPIGIIRINIFGNATLCSSHISSVHLSIFTQFWLCQAISVHQIYATHNIGFHYITTKKYSRVSLLYILVCRVKFPRFLERVSTKKSGTSIMKCRILWWPPWKIFVSEMCLEGGTHKKGTFLNLAFLCNMFSNMEH
jgi:hypothetical protein